MTGTAGAAMVSVAPPVPADGDDAAMVVVLYDWFGIVRPEDQDDYVALFDGMAEDNAAMAACMQEAGFEFPVYDPAVGAASRFADSSLQAPEEWAAEYGFGFAAGTLGMFASPDGDAEREDDDYFSSMTPGERQAFSAQAQECYGRGDAAADTPRQMAMNVAAPAYRERVLADARVIAAAAEWQACMAAAGFDFDNVEQMRQHFVDAVHSSSAALTDTELQRLLAAEREAALVNLDCEPAYHQTVRAVIFDRIDEFWTLFDSAMFNPPSNPLMTAVPAGGG